MADNTSTNIRLLYSDNNISNSTRLRLADNDSSNRACWLLLPNKNNSTLLMLSHKISNSTRSLLADNINTCNTTGLHLADTTNTSNSTRLLSVVNYASNSAGLLCNYYYQASTRARLPRYECENWHVTYDDSQRAGSIQCRMPKLTPPYRVEALSDYYILRGINYFPYIPNKHTTVLV